MNTREKLAIAAGVIGLSVCFCACTAAPGTSTPAGFTDDFAAAKAEAAKSDRKMLVVFSGSDWCHWCKVLEKSYLSKPEFVEAAKKDFVLVFIDMPEDKSRLSETAKKNNESLLRAYGIRGFPTVKILDAEGRSLADARPEGGVTPAGYAEQLRKAIAVGPRRGAQH